VGALARRAHGAAAALVRSGRRESAIAHARHDPAFEKVAAFPGAKVITGGGKPVTIQVPDGDIVGAGFEPATVNSEESVKF
jgi:hypothetical protein